MHMCSSQDKLQTTLLGISYCLLILNVVLLLKSFTLDDGKRGEYKIMAESVKTEQSVKIECFEALLWLKSENSKLTKDR